VAGGPAGILGNGRDEAKCSGVWGSGMTEGSLASHTGVRCTEKGLYGWQMWARWDFLATTGCRFKESLFWG